MKVNEETPNEIIAAIRQYAKEHNIVISGTITNLYSMLKHTQFGFPKNAMFLSYNLHGLLDADNSSVTIVCTAPDKITHCLSEHVLERNRPQETLDFNLRPRHSINCGGFVIDF